MHPGDLAQHTRFVQHRRAGLDALGEALVDDDPAGVGVGRVVQHLGRAGGGVHPLAQRQQVAQALVFQHQLVHLVGFERLLHQ